MRFCDWPGIKVVVELVPNHTSRLHPWFSASRQGGRGGTGAPSPYHNYYIWSKGRQLANGTRVPPNNWVSVTSCDILLIMIFFPLCFSFFCFFFLALLF